MPEKVDTTAKGYSASVKPHNKFLSHTGNILQLAGASYAVIKYGWLLLLPFIVIAILLTYFLGIPAFINILRCSQTYKTKKGHLTATLFTQGLWVLIMLAILSAMKISSMAPFFVILGIIRAFSIPRDQLLQERINRNNAHDTRFTSKEQYFRVVPDLRMGAPNWNQPWTPPDDFPRARLFSKLKGAHPSLHDIDAAFLIEETIYFFDDLPLKEPKRSELLLGKVEKEIDLYCSWSTARVSDWAQNPAGTGMSRSTGRNSKTNDLWLLQRIIEEMG